MFGWFARKQKIPDGSSVSKWRVEPNKISEVQKFGEAAIIRTYKLSNLPSAEMTTSLRLLCYISKDPSGTVGTELTFYLRPYLYLMPDQRPFPDHYVPAPFSVALMADGGAGTDASPLFEGGLFEVDGIEAEPETARLVAWGEGMHSRGTTPFRSPWVRAISSGREMTFSLFDKTGGDSKLKLRLPNDQEFRKLYNRVLSEVQTGGVTGW